MARLIEDSEPALASGIKTQNPDIRSIAIATEFLDSLKTNHTWTDGYGLTWTYEPPDLIKCEGNVWRIQWDEKRTMQGCLFYKATWPD